MINDIFPFQRNSRGFFSNRGSSSLAPAGRPRPGGALPSREATWAAEAAGPGPAQVLALLLFDGQRRQTLIGRLRDPGHVTLSACSCWLSQRVTFPQREQVPPAGPPHTPGWGGDTLTGRVVEGKLFLLLPHTKTPPHGCSLSFPALGSESK